jgi:hypothetical protein|tara:strand:- start:25 stop:213 length:189 start_codon:yes stop_codon:yes gene_type:complete
MKMNSRMLLIIWISGIIVGTTMGSDTKLLSSHTSMKVLENHYINPLLLNVEEEKLMKVKVFG